MDKNIKIFISVVVGLIIIIVATALVRSNDSGGLADSSAYDEFTICLKDKGAVFYGAFWCPHCQAQKKLFGSSVKLLPYEECSTADGNSQTQICIDKEIQSYPTWEFADGSRLTGEIPLLQLAEKTDCVLPNSEEVAPLSDEGASSEVQ